MSAHRGKTEICKYFIFLHALFGNAINIYATQVRCWSMGGEGGVVRLPILSLAGAATSIIFVATKALSLQHVFFATNRCFFSPKHVFCCDKSMLVAFCRDKTFIARDICRDKHNFVDKGFVATSLLLSRQIRPGL